MGSNRDICPMKRLLRFTRLTRIFLKRVFSHDTWLYSWLFTFFSLSIIHKQFLCLSLIITILLKTIFICLKIDIFIEILIEILLINNWKKINFFFGLISYLMLSLNLSETNTRFDSKLMFIMCIECCFSLISELLEVY